MRGVTDLSCILIIDEQVKEKMLSNIADLTAYGVEIIESVRDITEKMYKRTKDVVILGSYRFDGLDDLKIHKDLLNLNLFLITDDKLMAGLLKDFCTCVIMDYKSLNSNMLYSVLKNDTAEQSKYNIDSTYLTPAKELENILSTSGDTMLRNLCMDGLRLRGILEDKMNLEGELTRNIRKLESQNLQHIREIEQISMSLTELVAKAMKQNEVLKEHQIAFSRDFYDKIYLSSKKYNNRPKVLYFKEYEEILHESSFITTLFNSMAVQGKMAVKVVRLHDSCDSIRIKKLESSYYTITGEFLESSVVKEDYIVSFGNYKKLLDFLLVNKYKLDLLIIIDCKKFNDVVIHGEGVSYYYLCRSMKSSKIYNLNELRTVTNNNDSPMSWNTFPNYSKLSDNLDEKFRFLSSREPIKRIFNTVKNMV